MMTAAERAVHTILLNRLAEYERTLHTVIAILASSAEEKHLHRRDQMVGQAESAARDALIKANVTVLMDGKPEVRKSVVELYMEQAGVAK